MNKVGYLTGMLPGSFRNGTEIATAMIARAVETLGYDLQLLGILRADDRLAEGYRAHVIDTLPIEAETAPAHDRATWAFVSLLFNEPVSASKFRSDPNQEVAKFIKDFDCVLVDKPQMAYIYRQQLKGKRVSVIWHAIEHATYSDVAASSRGIKRWIYKREARLAHTLERKVAQTVDHVFALTSSDAAKIRELGFKGPITIFPLVMPNNDKDQVDHTPVIDPYDQGLPYVALLGNWLWSANRDGLDWFIDQVAPNIPSDIPILIGGNGSEKTKSPFPNIKGIGKVESAKNFLGKASVVAIPLVSGTGVSMKVVEAAAAGWPTVTTPTGKRGLDDLPENVLVAATPSEFADHVVASMKAESAKFLEYREQSAAWYKRRLESFHDALREGIETVCGNRPLAIKPTPSKVGNPQNAERPAQLIPSVADR